MCFGVTACGSGDHDETEDTMEEPAVELSGNISDFTTIDLDGNEVTGDIFASKDVTIVNIWGTFCPPCIKELPDLQIINESLPDNAQMIGILCDVMDRDCDEYKDALKLIQDNGLTYSNILVDPSMSFMDNVMYVPTTILVDSEGNVIGEPIVGSDISAYKKALNDYLGE